MRDIGALTALGLEVADELMEGKCARRVVVSLLLL